MSEASVISGMERVTSQCFDVQKPVILLPVSTVNLLESFWHSIVEYCYLWQLQIRLSLKTIYFCNRSYGTTFKLLCYWKVFTWTFVPYSRPSRKRVHTKFIKNIFNSNIIKIECKWNRNKYIFNHNRSKKVILVIMVFDIYTDTFFFLFGLQSI